MEETRCRNPSKIYPPNHPNPIKITQKSLPNPPKMPPKPLQNGPESLPIMKKDRLQPPKREVCQNYSESLRRFSHFWGPNGPQIWWKSEEKSMVKKTCFSESFFHGLGLVLEVFFRDILRENQLHFRKGEKSKNLTKHWPCQQKSRVGG